MMVLIDKARSFFFFFEYALGLRIEDWGIFDDYGPNRMLELVFPDLPFCTCCLVSRHIPCLHGQVKTQEAGQALASSRVQLAQPLATPPHWISLRNSTSLLHLERSRVHARRISNPIGPYLPVNREGLISIAVWRRPESTADTSTKHNLNSNSRYSCMVAAGSVLNDKCTLSEDFSFPSLGFLSIS